MAKVDKIGAIASGALDILGSAVANTRAKDTSAIKKQIEGLEDTVYTPGNYNNILDSYYANVATTPSFDLVEDYMLTPEEYANNVVNGALGGAQAGYAFDLGGYAPTIGAGIGALVSAATIPFSSANAREDFAIDSASLTEALANNTAKMNTAIKNTKDMLASNAMRNLVAFGGDLKMAPNPADFTNGVKKVENGGDHEENPYQGVPMGIAEDGKPNLVEEGEVIYNNYVFSKRLIADEGLLSTMQLPKKYKDKSFAYIAEDLSKESANRPLDSISKNGLNANLAKLMQIQEVQRQREAEYQEYNDYENAVNMAANGGSIDIKPSKKGTFTALATRKGMSLPELSADIQAHPNKYSPEARKKEVFYRNFAHRKAAGGDLGIDPFLMNKYPNDGIEGLYSQFVWRENHPNEPYPIPFKQKVKAIIEESAQQRLWNEHNRKRAVEDSKVYKKLDDLDNKYLNNTFLHPYYEKNRPLNKGHLFATAGPLGSTTIGMDYDGNTWTRGFKKSDFAPQLKVIPQGFPTGIIFDDTQGRLLDAFGMTDWEAHNPIVYEEEVEEEPINLTKGELKLRRQVPDASIKPNLGIEDEEGRFFPVLAGAVQAGTDILGLSNPYDYTQADIIKDSANYIRDISAQPFGQRVSVTPVDVNYDMINAGNALAGYRRSLADLAGGNRALAIAALQGAAANGVAAQGDIRRKAQSIQDERLVRALQMNNALEQALSAQEIQAAQANQQAGMQRAATMQKWAAARDAVDTAVSEARGKNLTNANTLIGQGYADKDTQRRALEYATSLGILDPYLNNMQAEKAALSAKGGKIKTKKSKKYFTR